MLSDHYETILEKNMTTKLGWEPTTTETYLGLALYLLDTWN